MIAQRFRSIGWVAGVATAATALYMISLQVASERGRLEAVDREIAAAQRDIRQLQTELGTRGSLRQLERWNGDVLALTAPDASQFLAGEAALARLDGVEPGRGAAPAVMTAQAAAPSDAEAHVVKPEVEVAIREQDHQVQVAMAPRVTRAAVVVRKPERVALLDTHTLSDLGHAAFGEARSRAKQ